MVKTDQPTNILPRLLGRHCCIGRWYIKAIASAHSLCPKFGTIVLMSTILSTNANAESVIYAIGDSITRGIVHTFDSEEYPLSAYRNGGGFPSNIRSYREHTHDALIAPGCEADITWVGAREENNRSPNRHEGRSGFRVDQILNNTWRDDENRFSAMNIDGWLATFQPDVVLIHLGTNDITEGEDAVSTSNELDELINRVYSQQPNATVVLANVIPIHGWWASHVKLAPFSIQDIAGEVTALAGLIANIVSTRQANGDDIHLVDVNSGFFVDEANLTICGSSSGNPNNMSTTSCKEAPDGSGMVPDGIHPNLLGEAFIGRQFADVLINQVGLCEIAEDVSPTIPDSAAPIASDDPSTPDADTFATSVADVENSQSAMAPETTGAAQDVTVFAGGGGAFVEFYGCLIALAIATFRRRRRFLT